MDQNIYIVASYTDTVPGKMIRARAAMKFWNRYAGDEYSHVSLSRDSKLDNMMSFARKDLHNPFHSGIVKEDIRSGMFALRPDKSKIAVMELGVTKKQYDHLGEVMNSYWLKREELGFNFAGLISMLFFGVGVPVEGEFFCSQWVATVLQEVGIDLFPEKSLYNIRPFDFYCLLQQQIIYEGMSKDYMSNQPITPISAVESKILKKSLKQI